ncbi:MAG TPA: GntR family transcriptional regulator [Streptomyces sp.]
MSSTAGTNGTVRKPPSSAKRDLVRDHLLAIIADCDPGSSLPAERELADRLDVSRPTVRAAIRDLAHTGLLVRQPGRGTFTSPHKVTQELSTTSPAQGVPPAEGTWTSRVVSVTTSAPGPARTARLGLEPEDRVTRVVRVRLVDSEPIAIERIELPASLVPGLQAVDLESGNFYQLLRERFGVRVAEAVQIMEPTVANPEQAELLEVPAYFPLLQVERTTQDVGGRVVEFVQSVYRGDRYRITSRLRFDQSSG